MMYPDYRLVENESIRGEMEDFWGRTLDPKRGLTVVEIMDAIHDDEISGMYIMGENPAMSDPDQIHARSALAKLDHLVVQDIFLTETCWHADVVLPASAHAEKLLANRVGLDWKYDGVGDVYTEMASVMNSLNYITWERLNDEDVVCYPVDEPGGFGNEVIFTNGFPTVDGRGKIVPADLLAPDEVPDEEFPLVLTTGRLLEHWHTGAMTRRSAVLDEIEPEGIAAMNGRMIDKLGLETGQMIEVSTRRGTIQAVLRQDRDVAEFKYCAAKVGSAKQVEAAE